jgi:Tfp pilus assembly protein PilN
VKSQNTAPPEVDPVKSEQVLILPGYLFFVESIEVPEELESSEIADFAELSLESIAPFPIEKLYWGYLYKSGMRTLLLYAAYHRRIKSEGFADLDDYAWVIPDFATLYGAHFDDDVLVLLEGNDSVSMMYFQGGTEVPKSVWIDTLTEPLTENSIQRLRSEIRDLPESTPALHLRPAIVELTENGLPTFEHTASEQTEGRLPRSIRTPLTPTESQLWQMDVRSVDFKKAEQSRRRMSAWIVRITGWAAVFALILTGVEGLLFASQSWLKNQLARVESQQEAVLKVEEKQTLVNKLNQVAQNQLRPIEMLEAANEIRLKLSLGIEYDSVVIEGENHITIEGKASSITALNRYVESLKNSGLFKLLDEQKPITRNGQTTFKVSLAYSPKAALTGETPNPDGESAAAAVSSPEEGIAV